VWFSRIDPLSPSVPTRVGQIEKVALGWVALLAVALAVVSVPPVVAQASAPRLGSGERISATAAEEPRSCDTSKGKGYSGLHVTGVSCRTGVRLAVEWRRKAFGGKGRANVRIDRWRCRLTEERGEGSVVRCSRDRNLVAWYPDGPAAPAPGFQIDLAGASGAHLECYVSRASLKCLNYSRAKAPGRCEFGGDVPTVELARRSQAHITFTCVDEGFHDWERLQAVKTFSSGPFRCRPSTTRRTLRCASITSGLAFSISSNGRVKFAQ